MANTFPDSLVLSASDSPPNENPLAMANQPESCPFSATTSADSLTEEGFVLVGPSVDPDAEHLSNCKDRSADSTTEEGFVLVDPCTDSDSDSILFTDSRVSAASSSDITAEKLPARPPFQRKLCRSGFCGVSAIKHPIGPYLHGGNLPPKDLSDLGLSSPPWDCANPPQQVWEAWIDSFPAGVGPERDTLQQRTAKHQREVDLVDGFIAHHSWIPDENKFHPAAMLEFKEWSENWKSQRERGILRPKVKKPRW
ncbi:hypothetical protein MMC29_001602 [Sticta canariensis]|nr:hypothetical protein [Sticta canariensis]